MGMFLSQMQVFPGWGGKAKKQHELPLEPVMGLANPKGGPETRETLILLTAFTSQALTLCLLPAHPLGTGSSGRSVLLVWSHLHLCLVARGTHAVIITRKVTTTNVCGGFHYLQTICIPRSLCS